MHPAIQAILVGIVLIVVALIAQVAYTAIKKHESPFAVLSADEQSLVGHFRNLGADVKAYVTRGVAIAEGVVQRVDADVISILHKAETEGTLIKGTVSAYVEKFLGLKQTDTPAPAAATPAAPAPAPAPVPEPATLTISGTPEQIAAAQAAVQAATTTGPVILHAAGD